MSGSAKFLELLANRRTHYALGKDLPVGKDKVIDIVHKTIISTPTSFNSQSNRAVVLFGADHEKFWDIATAALKPLVPAENWAQTEQKLTMFKAGAGTVLFFKDQSVVEEYQAKFALYADNFPIWATQSEGMLQFAVWLALEAENVGANLQHYNPVVDEQVYATWGVPKNWKLSAQLVFGNKAGQPGPKQHLPTDQTVKVFGA